MLVIVALSNIIIIDDDISLGYYLFTLPWMIIGGHLFLKVWEWKIWFMQEKNEFFKLIGREVLIVNATIIAGFVVLSFISKM